MDAFIFLHCFNLIMSFAVVHGIVVLSLIKAVKYSLVPLYFWQIFKYIIKNKFVLLWFSSYMVHGWQSFNEYLGKIPIQTRMHSVAIWSAWLSGLEMDELISAQNKNV